jgi:Glutaredoxin and related proteins
MITVYSRPGCGMCERTKKLLDKAEVEYTEVVVDDAIEKQIMAQGFTGPYPYVVTDTDHWSGFRYEKLKVFRK